MIDRIIITIEYAARLVGVSNRRLMRMMVEKGLILRRRTPRTYGISVSDTLKLADHCAKNWVREQGQQADRGTQ